MIKAIQKLLRIKPNSEMHKNTFWKSVDRKENIKKLARDLEDIKNEVEINLAYQSAAYQRTVNFETFFEIYEIAKKQQEILSKL